MALSAPALVIALKRVDLPTLGSPTIPNFISIVTSRFFKGFKTFLMAAATFPPHYAPFAAGTPFSSCPCSLEGAPATHPLYHRGPCQARMKFRSNHKTCTNECLKLLTFDSRSMCWTGCRGNKEILQYGTWGFIIPREPKDVESKRCQYAPNNYGDRR